MMRVQPKAFACTIVSLVLGSLMWVTALFASGAGHGTGTLYGVFCAPMYLIHPGAALALGVPWTVGTCAIADLATGGRLPRWSPRLVFCLHLLAILLWNAVPSPRYEKLGDA